jgi:ribosome-associated translation inhibitor RaiA
MTARSEVAAVKVTVRGDLHNEDRSYALDKVDRVLMFAGAPILGAHLVLGWARDPAQPHPAHLEIGLNVNGVPLRAHVAADSMREGADLLQERLRRQLVQLHARTHTQHRWSDAVREPEWHSAEKRRKVPEDRRRSPETLEIVRRKTFALHPLTVDEAAYEMDLLDHDFYLFTDETDSEVVVYRGIDQDHAVLTAPPVLTERQAMEHLDLAGEPFVFYRDVTDGRGRVLYDRFDGDYGLIMPA